MASGSDPWPLDPLPPDRAPHPPAEVAVGVGGAGGRAQAGPPTVAPIRAAGTTG